MDEFDDDEGGTYQLTPNVIESGTLLGIPHRNWIEAVASSLIAVFIITAIPFTPVYTGVLCIMVSSALIAINLKGIQNRSVTQMIVAEISFLKNRRILHLRGPEYAKTVQNFNMYLNADKSNGEIILGKITEALNNYADNVLEREGIDMGKNSEQKSEESKK